MRVDPLQHVDEIRVRIDPRDPTRRDQLLRPADLLGPAEQPIVLSEINRPRRPRREIRVY